MLPSQAFARALREGVSILLGHRHHQHPARRCSTVLSSPSVVGGKVGCQHPACQGSHAGMCGRLGSHGLFPLKVFSFPSGKLLKVGNAPTCHTRASGREGGCSARLCLPKNGIPAAQRETCSQQGFILSSDSTFVSKRRDWERASMQLGSASRQIPHVPSQLQPLGRGEGSTGGTGQASAAEPGMGLSHGWQ